MTTEEVFTKIRAHMRKGLMVHEQLANYYHFLALEGYKCCHEYHFLVETLECRQLQMYYTDKYNKLIPDYPVDDPHIIPDTWFKHKRKDVNSGSKRSYIEAALTHWFEWETDTHKIYCDMYKELENNGEYSAANYVQGLIDDVEEELLDIEKKQLKLMSVDYSMEFIVQRQKSKKKHYLEKMKHLL